MRRFFLLAALAVCANANAELIELGNGEGVLEESTGFTYAQGGITLTAATSTANRVLSRNNSGLGIKEPGAADQGQPNSIQRGETLVLDFGQDVFLNAIEIAFFGVELTGGEQFNLMLDGQILSYSDTPNAADSFLQPGTSTIFGPNGTGGNVVQFYGFGAGLSGSVLTITGSEPVNAIFPSFRVFSVDVTPVPLPAGVWLLLSGLGGFAALRRRVRAAR